MTEQIEGSAGQGKADPSRRADLSSEVAFWKDEIDTYERIFDKFLRRGRKIMKKYKDVRSPREDAATRYNILWANTQTRLPALYARNPKPVVERRFKDKDPVGRVTSEILERSIEYTLDHCNDAWQVNRQCVLDYELPGRGIVWLRYVPHFHKVDASPEEAAAAGSGPPPVRAKSTPGEASQPLTPGNEGDGGPRPHGSDLEIDAMGVQTSNVEESEVDEETLRYEETKLDYVYWEDYGHSWARVDDEIRGKWRRVYMDREELEERFQKSKANPDGLSEDEIKGIPLDWSPKNLTDTKIPMSQKKAIVYEIWDKRRRQVLWVVKNFPELLDKRPDPLNLKDFFPCPRALAANLMNDELTPTPNFVYYQDQANEIDELSTRISQITKCLKVAGVRDSSAEGLDRLLSEGVENQLVPVNGWAAMKEKGGLKGTFELLPMQEIVETLASMREQRKELIEDVYQLTGIADIVRGLSDPNETATAQQIKGQFSMVRLEDSQAEVQRFCRDEIQIIGQIVATYSIETIKAICGVKLLTAAEKQQIQMQLAAQARMQQMQAMIHPQPSAQGPSAPSPGGPPPISGGPGAGLPPGQGAQPMQAPPSPTSGPVQPQMGAQPPQQAIQPGGGMHPGAPSAAQSPSPGQAPVSPDKMRLLELPTWEEVEALLQNPVMREFRLDIETDSTIRMDEEAEKKARVELIATVSDFLTKMVEAGMQAPEILPMLGELLMFGLRAFKTARAVEQTFDDMMEALEKQAKQPRPPPPEVLAAQIKSQADIGIAQHKAQLDTQVEQAKQAAETQRAQQDSQISIAQKGHELQLQGQLESHKAQLQAHTDTVVQDLKNQFEAQRVQWETAAKERIALLDAHTKLQIAGMDREHEGRMRSMEMQHEGVQKDADRKHSERVEGAKLAVTERSGAEERKHKEKLQKEAPEAKNGEKVAGALKEISENLKKPRKVKRDESGRIAELS